jgi:hypothetical protein
VEEVFDGRADPANLVAAPLVLKADWAKGSIAACAKELESNAA